MSTVSTKKALLISMTAFCFVSAAAEAVPSAGVFSPEEESVADTVLNRKLNTVLSETGRTHDLMLKYKAKLPYDTIRYANRDITKIVVGPTIPRIPWQVLHLASLANRTAPFAQAIGASNIDVVLTDSSSVNARTFGRTGTQDVTIEFFDGLTYHPDMNRDTLTFIYCHELGHQSGGYPFYNYSDWVDYRLSSEGNSDFFAAGRCMEFLMRDETALNQQAADTAEPEIRDACMPRRLRPIPLPHPLPIGRINPEILRTPGPIGPVIRPTAIPVPAEKPNGICVRTVRAAYNGFANILGKTVAVNTPSTSETSTTLYNSYPAGQCRLDTAVHAARCSYRPDSYYSRPGTSPADSDVVNENAIGATETCWTGYGLNDFFGSPRPKCWFKQALDR